ncbi:MAG: ATP-dependent Clp protease adapter ClpS [Albidovulum sp.]|nr:ATP-dependent Clp protease adapter ClpS [Albidovulum sp.]MDE0531601.1 ATP-dependent Clp protease adapter ClpS [Albidovulum sp.]
MLIEPAASGSGRPDGANGREDTGVLTRPKATTSKPPMYKVILINDDYTPMEFVVYVLQRFFSMPSSNAVQLMLKVHQTGSAVVGVFAREIAETKVKQVMDLARANDHPLLCTMEKE